MLVGKACEEFICQCRIDKNLATNTLRAYTIDLQQFQNFVGANQSTSKCDKTQLRAYLAHLLVEKQLKESSVKRRIASLKSMFRWLEDEELLPANPFHRLNFKIKIPPRLPKTLSRAEIKKLLQAPLAFLRYQQGTSFAKIVITNLTNHEKNHFTTLTALELLFSTGIRVGELVGISTHDVDLKEGVITIIGKGNKQRRVFITDSDIKALLKRYLHHRERCQPSTDILLLTSRGTPATTQFIRKLVIAAGKNAGLDKRVTPHMLRHSAATQLLESGLDIRYVQKLLGHHCISVTQIYTHVTDTNLKTMIQKINPRKEVLRKSSDN